MCGLGAPGSRTGTVLRSLCAHRMASPHGWGLSAPGASDLSSPVWAESENQADSMTLRPPPRVSACLASSSKTRTQHKVCVGRGAYDPSQNPGSILWAFSNVQEAKDGGDLALVPQSQTSKRKCSHVIMAPWVLHGQGHFQLKQEAKRVTTHHCKAPACGRRAGGSVPPLLSTGGQFGPSL